MVMVVMTQSPALVYQNLKKRHGKENVSVVTDVKKLPDTKYLIYLSMSDYAQNPALDKKCVVCDIPLKYEGRLRTLEIADEVKYDLDFEKLIDNSKVSNLTKVPKGGKVKRVKDLTHKVVDTFKPSSMIDKVHTYVYACTTNKNRTPVRYVFSDYVLNDWKKSTVLEKLKALKVKTKPESEDLLNAIFDYMELPIGKQFRLACKKALKEEKKKDGIAYDVIAREYGVDKFDVKTVLLNCSK